MKHIDAQKLGASYLEARTGGRKRRYQRYVCSCGEIFSQRADLTPHKACRLCREKPNSLPDGEASRNHFFYWYRKNASNRGYSFSLTRAWFDEETAKECRYCGAPPSAYRSKGAATPAYLNGLDRVDNTLGYSIDNVVPCCTVCNYMKRSMSKDDFLLHVSRIVAYNTH